MDVTRDDVGGQNTGRASPRPGRTCMPTFQVAEIVSFTRTEENAVRAALLDGGWNPDELRTARLGDFCFMPGSVEIWIHSLYRERVVVQVSLRLPGNAAIAAAIAEVRSIYLDPDRVGFRAVLCYSVLYGCAGSLRSSLTPGVVCLVTSAEYVEWGDIYQGVWINQRFVPIEQASNLEDAEDGQIWWVEVTRRVCSSGRAAPGVPLLTHDLLAPSTGAAHCSRGVPAALLSVRRVSAMVTDRVYCLSPGFTMQEKSRLAAYEDLRRALSHAFPESPYTCELLPTVAEDHDIVEMESHGYSLIECQPHELRYVLRVPTDGGLDKERPTMSLPTPDEAWWLLPEDGPESAGELLQAIYLYRSRGVLTNLLAEPLTHLPIEHLATQFASLHPQDIGAVADYLASAGLGLTAITPAGARLFGTLERSADLKERISHYSSAAMRAEMNELLGLSLSWTAVQLQRFWTRCDEFLAVWRAATGDRPVTAQVA
jgi:hypothetical protein